MTATMLGLDEGDAVSPRGYNGTAVAAAEWQLQAFQSKAVSLLHICATLSMFWIYCMVSWCCPNAPRGASGGQ